MINPTIVAYSLKPAGSVLLLGTFGYSILRTMQGREIPAVTTERVILAAVCMAFYGQGFEVLNRVSNELQTLVLRLGEPTDLKRLIAEAFERSSQEPGPGGTSTHFNIPAMVEQAWRLGVWGVMNTVADWFFLLTDLLIRCAQSLLSSILFLIFPLCVGVLPIAPRVILGAALYLIEMALWLPCQDLIHIFGARIAKSYIMEPGTLGMKIVAIELIVVVLLLSIPAFVHRLFLGAQGLTTSGSEGAHLGQRSLAISKISESLR